ncbi:MAG: hypothetical protein FJ087_11625 [Deltaproteobacteria bacterium]|nr:hypothetical protein [Deltaproteobacteria bacterium]
MTSIRDLVRDMTPADFVVGVDTGMAAFLPHIEQFVTHNRGAGDLRVRPGSVLHAFALYSSRAARVAEAMDELRWARREDGDRVAGAEARVRRERECGDPASGRVAALIVDVERAGPLPNVRRCVRLGSFGCPTDSLMVTDPCRPRSADPPGTTPSWQGCYERARAASRSAAGAGLFVVAGDVCGVVCRAGHGDGTYACYREDGRDGTLRRAVISFDIEPFR